MSRDIWVFGYILGAILAAPIRVVNQTRYRSLGVYSPADQILRHALCHGITYDFSGENILMAGKIQLAGNVRYVRQPDLVRYGCLEFLTPQILLHFSKERSPPHLPYPTALPVPFFDPLYRVDKNPC